MNSSAAHDVAEALLGASLPIDPNTTLFAAQKVIEFYRGAPRATALSEEEVADRFSEMWENWLDGNKAPSKELKDVIHVAIGADPEMERLASEYFKLEKKLEENQFMSRSYAIALIGCSPLIRSLVEEQHLGLDRIRTILNIPGATFDAVRNVLSSIGIQEAFSASDIPSIHAADTDDVASLFGDTPADEADSTFRNLLGSFSQNDELWENVVELTLIDYEPYLFMLYNELLTLERTDRFPGRAIYELSPRSQYVKNLWNEMYNPTQENPYLNNAKSVYSLDYSWAETKLSRETGNGSLLLADVFEILMRLPYSTRRKVAHVIRCYLVLKSQKNSKPTMLPCITREQIKAFVETVASSNSLTKGVLDQRLVDFLTSCGHEYSDWLVRGLGSAVNESNAAGRKYGDVEYLGLDTRTRIEAYEAHGGGLRDEYVEDHINSLVGTVSYLKKEALNRGEEYRCAVSITYVAHDVSRLSRYSSGYTTNIEGVEFTFRFITFFELLDEVGGLGLVSDKTELFDELIHSRISRLPDSYSLKQRYKELLSII